MSRTGVRPVVVVNSPGSGLFQEKQWNYFVKVGWKYRSIVTTKPFIYNFCLYIDFFKFNNNNNNILH
jgi:hypothetical protein